MTENAKRAITFIVLAVGIILLIVGAATTAYSTWIGIIIFLCFLAASIALRKLWGLRKEKSKKE